MSNLRNQSIIITRPAHQAAAMSRAVRERGGQPVEYPVLAIERVVEPQLSEVTKHLQTWARGEADALLLTSANAAQVVVQLWRERRLTWTCPPPPVFAVGPKTASILSPMGLLPLVPEQHTGAALLQLVLGELGPKVARATFVFPRAKEGREEVIAGLLQAGATVHALPVYETRLLVEGPPLPDSLRIDWLTFTSPSAVHAFAHRAEVPPGSRVACIGPTTAAAAQEKGWEVDVCAPLQTIEALLDAIANAY